MQAKTKLAILQQLNRRHSRATGLAKGFTLVELMIVVAVIGILSAVALPQYLQARAAAAQGAAVGEALGLAKECATFVASGGIGTIATGAQGNSTVTCPTGGGTVVTKFTGGGAAGVRCLTAAGAVGNGTVTVTVSSSGTLSCAFGE